MSRIPSKPIRTVLRWQAIATLLCTAAAGYFAGAHGAWSALLGGSVSLLAGLAFAWVISRNTSQTAGGTLVTALKAEAAKIGVVVVLLWAVFATYEQLAPMIFLGTFFATILLFSMAFFVREKGGVNGDLSNGR